VSDDSVLDVQEVHLLEKFCVRLGPTLSLLELCFTSAKKQRQSVGMHRMCIVDGEQEEYRNPGFYSLIFPVVSNEIFILYLTF
jgi:hypothetical protein